MCGPPGRSLLKGEDTPFFSSPPAGAEAAIWDHEGELRDGGATGVPLEHMKPSHGPGEPLALMNIRTTQIFISFKNCSILYADQVKS